MFCKNLDWGPPLFYLVAFYDVQDCSFKLNVICLSWRDSRNHFALSTAKGKVLQGYTNFWCVASPASNFFAMFWWQVSKSYLVFFWAESPSLQALLIHSPIHTQHVANQSKRCQLIPLLHLFGLRANAVLCPRPAKQTCTRCCISRVPAQLRQKVVTNGWCKRVGAASCGASAYLLQLLGPIHASGACDFVVSHLSPRKPHKSGQSL